MLRDHAEAMFLLSDDKLCAQVFSYAQHILLIRYLSAAMFMNIMRICCIAHSRELEGKKTVRESLKIAAQLLIAQLSWNIGHGGSYKALPW